MQVVDDVGAVHALDTLGHAGVERVFEWPFYRSRVDLVRAGRAQSAFLPPERLLVRHFACCHAAHVEPAVHVSQSEPTAIYPDQDLRDSSLAFKPDLDVLDTHSIRCRQTDNTVQLDSLGFMLVTVEDDKAVVWAIGQGSAVEVPIVCCMAST